MIQEGIQAYMKEHPDVEVKLVPAPESSTVRLMIYREYLTNEDGRKKIDVYQIDVIWPGEIGHHFVDLNQYGAAEAAKEHFPELIQNNTVDEKLVAMPWFTDAGLLYYRTDLLEKYGYSVPPETWDELEEMARKIQEGERAAGRENFWGFVWQGDVYEGLTCDVLEWGASHDGGTFIDPDKTVTINNPQALKALKRAASWDGVFMNAVARPSGVASPRYSRASDLIFNTVHDVLTGKKDAQAALDALEIDLEDLLASD